MALAPGLLFYILFAASRSRVVLTVAFLWLAYLAYEYGMKLRILCSGECNIRIDLLLIHPALIVSSHVGWSCSRWRFEVGSSRHDVAILTPHDSQPSPSRRH